MNLDGLVFSMDYGHDVRNETDKFLVVSTSTDKDKRPPFGVVAMIEPPAGYAKYNVIRLLLKFKLWLLDRFDTCLDEDGDASVSNGG